MKNITRSAKCCQYCLFSVEERIGNMAILLCNLDDSHKDNLSGNKFVQWMEDHQVYRTEVCDDCCVI
jgi:hypothetical protein